MEPQKKLKIVCASDTHGKNKSLLGLEGDIFIHAGDFTFYSNKKSLLDFCAVLDQLKFKHKIVICGNHEILFDPHAKKENSDYFRKKYAETNKTPQQLKAILKQHCTYLEHQSIEVEGIKIFGSPYTVHYHDTGFHYQPHEEKHIWDGIPDKVDILITHGPPFGILDKTIKGQDAGSKYLLERVKKIQPRLHIFGHIHESAGHKTIPQLRTLFINAGQLNRDYVVANKPYLIQYTVNNK